MKQLLTALLIAFLVFGCEEKAILPAPCPAIDDSESKYGVIHKQDIMLRGLTLYNQYSDGFLRSQKNPDSMMFFMGAMKGSRETESSIYSLTYKPISGDLWTKPSPKPSPLPDTTKPTGKLRMTTDGPAYVGTPTKLLAVDSLGNIIEVDTTKPLKISNMENNETTNLDNIDIRDFVPKTKTEEPHICQKQSFIINGCWTVKMPNVTTSKEVFRDSHNLKYGFKFEMMLQNNHYCDVTMRMPDGTWALGDHPALALEELFQMYEAKVKFIEELYKKLSK